MKHRILIAGDIHFPWASSQGLKKFYDLAKALNPTHIIQIGDLYDFYSFSRFPKSLDLITPKQEIERAREDAQQFWLTLKVICPKAKKHQLIGNHDERLNKMIIGSFPEAESIISPWALFDFKNVETQRGERDELLIENICFMHGFRSKLGDHARANSTSTVVGHSHLGGTVFFRLGSRILFELNVGYLGHEPARIFSYTKQRQFARWTLGCGWIDQNGPRFIPFGANHA